MTYTTKRTLVKIRSCCAKSFKKPILFSFLPFLISIKTLYSLNYEDQTIFMVSFICAMVFLTLGFWMILLSIKFH